MAGLCKVTEQSMIEAHQAGMIYWKRNKPRDATDSSLRPLAQSLGWHDGDMYAFVAGFYGAQRREQTGEV